MDINMKYSILQSHAWATGRIYAVLILRIANLHSCFLVQSSIIVQDSLYHHHGMNIEPSVN